MQIKLTAYGLDALQRGFEQAPAMARRELMTSMREAVALLEAAAKGEFPHHTGDTRNSIAGDAYATPMGALGVVGSPSPVAAFVELGTRPHRPPIEPLVQWVADVLGETGPAGRQVAFKIRSKISKRGTEPRKVFELALGRNWGTVSRIFEHGAQRIAANLAAGAA